MKIDEIKIGETGLGKVYKYKYCDEHKETLYKFKLKQELLIIEYLRYIRMSDEEIYETLNNESLFSAYLSSIDQVLDDKRLIRR